MPELPEVEVVKEGLKKIIKPSDTIEKIEFLRKDLRWVLPHASAKKIKGQKILNLFRRAKYILLETEDFYLISHLGMTGSWRKDVARKLHDHIVLRLTSGTQLIYNDPRRFGVFDIIEKQKLQNDKKFKHLGPEPLLRDEFTAAYLFKKSRARKVPIKSFIMDQKVVVGVGNIYASEALYLAGVRPLASAAKLSKLQSEALVLAIQQILTKAIELGGSSIRDYKQASGEAGGFQDHHFVYGRDKQPCRKCRGLIRSKVLSGRNTFWCVKCQK
jgi:formamidopyrimidine-DNA glycosylase